MWTYCSMCAGNLENCSSPVPITPSIPLITSPSPHNAWEPSMLNFYTKKWVVLYKKDAQNKFMYRIWDCKCPWVKARKLYGDAPIEVYMGDGSWTQVDWQEVVTHHFVKFPIGFPTAMPEETTTVCTSWNGYFWRRECYVRCNLAVHRSVTPFVIRQPIRRPCLLERVYKPMRTSH